MAKSIMDYWHKAQKMPAGRFFFNKLLGFMVPYTGSISPKVLELRPGFARAQITDRRGIRNHLNSVHAIALMNLGELVTGLAMTSQLTGKGRAIITKLEMEYHKKARGVLEASCTYEGVDELTKAEHRIQSEIRNTKGEVVATAYATWLIGPK